MEAVSGLLVFGRVSEISRLFIFVVATCIPCGGRGCELSGSFDFWVALRGGSVDEGSSSELGSFFKVSLILLVLAEVCEGSFGVYPKILGSDSLGELGIHRSIPNVCIPSVKAIFWVDHVNLQWVALAWTIYLCGYSTN